MTATSQSILSLLSKPASLCVYSVRSVVEIQNFICLESRIEFQKQRQEQNSPICQGLRLFTGQSSLPVNKHYFDVDENEYKWPV